MPEIKRDDHMNYYVKLETLFKNVLLLLLNYTLLHRE